MRRRLRDPLHRSHIGAVEAALRNLASSWKSRCADAA